MLASPHRWPSMECFVCLDPLDLDVFHNCLELHFPIQQLSTIFFNSQFLHVKQAEAGFKWTLQRYISCTLSWMGGRGVSDSPSCPSYLTTGLLRWTLHRADVIPIEKVELV